MPPTRAFSRGGTARGITREPGWRGAIDAQGYRRIGIDRVFYKAHRLAWLYVHGVAPRDLMDHIDGNRDNNRIANLREATAAQNAANSKAKNPNSLKGTSFNVRRNEWVAQIEAGGKNYCLGRFKSEQEAHAAYCAKADELFGEFAKY